MDIVTKRERRRDADDGELPQLLDSPLPTPRRSSDAPRPRRRPDASPLRTQVPFSWESSPGVPKSSAGALGGACGAQEAAPPPRPPPGRWTTSTCPARNWCYGNAASEASSDEDDDDSTSFSDALDRISSSPERIGSFDRVTSKRFEDIFVGRATSFAKDRSGHGHVAGAASSSSSGRNPKHWRRIGARRDRDVDRRSTDPVQAVHLVPRFNIEARVEQMSPRACGLMVFFPWSAKPTVCGLKSPPPPPQAGANAPPCPSSRISRRSTTLRDAIKKEKESRSDSGSHDHLPHQQQQPPPRGEKRSREEWQSRGWGVSSLLGTSKKYCTDHARRALSKLSIGLGADRTVAAAARESAGRGGTASRMSRQCAGHGREPDAAQD